MGTPVGRCDNMAGSGSRTVYKLTAIKFNKDFSCRYGVLERVSPLLRRIVAPNPQGSSPRAAAVRNPIGPKTFPSRPGNSGTLADALVSCWLPVSTTLGVIFVPLRLSAFA